MLKFTQPLCMFARMPALSCSRVTAPGPKERNSGKLTQICRIYSVLVRPIRPRNEATSSELPVERSKQFRP